MSARTIRESKKNHDLMPPASPQDNNLLAMFPNDTQDRLFPHLELCSLQMGTVLYEAGDMMRHVYFPTNSIIGLVYEMEDGASAEMSVVGLEGVLGIAAFMGGEISTSRVLVLHAGDCYRLPVQYLKQEFNQDSTLRSILLRYTQSLINQMGQTAVCNRHHTIEQQLCRWLLMSLDRLPGDTIRMTQELIANMLGVRRESVTEAAIKLQQRDIIRYQRGRITVVDRSELESTCCECYAVVKKESIRLCDHNHVHQPVAQNQTQYA